VQTGQGRVLIDMRTAEAGTACPLATRAALGALYPASALYVSCGRLASHPQTAQKLANAFVRTLRFIGASNGATIAAKMPADCASGDLALYTNSPEDAKAMFTKDGVIDEACPRRRHDRAPVHPATNGTSVPTRATECHSSRSGQIRVGQIRRMQGTAGRAGP
jgi:hypothetical protein